MIMHTAGDTRYGNRASGIHQLQTGWFQQLIPQDRNCSATSSSEYSRDGSRKKPQTLQQADQPLSYGCFKYVYFHGLLNLDTIFLSRTNKTHWQKTSYKTVGAAAVVVGLAAYRVYAARKSASAWEDLRMKKPVSRGVKAKRRWQISCSEFVYPKFKPAYCFLED